MNRNEYQKVIERAMIANDVMGTYLIDQGSKGLARVDSFSHHKIVSESLRKMHEDILYQIHLEKEGLPC